MQVDCILQLPAVCPPWNQKMEKISDAHEFDLAAGASSLGVQLMGPPQEADDFWKQGRYRITVSVRTNDESCDIKTSFSVEVGSYEADRVKEYSAWKKADWDRWRDPDRAIGVPVQIDRSSFAMSA